MIATVGALIMSGFIGTGFCSFWQDDNNKATPNVRDKFFTVNLYDEITALNLTKI
jgi:hypothetical protein